MRRIVFALLLLAAGGAGAHKPSDSYLTLHTGEGTLGGRWDIALRDLDFALGLDADGDGAITWGELSDRHAAIAAYAFARLQLSADGRSCVLRATEHLVERHSDGSYAVLRFATDCRPADDAIEVRYNLFFDLDPTHRGLLRLEAAGRSTSAVFSQSRAQQRVEIGRSAWRVLADYGREGVWHIWTGFDHVLFLIALLLPAVWLRERGAWRTVERFTPAFWEVFRVVTAFTAAHSITLGAAALGWLVLPSRLVESVIAASVVLAALNNLFPVVSGRRWTIAFGFGLMHGFGFASVLSDLGLPAGALAAALLGFNLGVEAGQLAIVAVFLPLAWAVRDTRFYRRAVFAGGSTAVAVLAGVWLAERALDLKLITG